MASPQGCVVHHPHPCGTCRECTPWPAPGDGDWSRIITKTLDAYWQERDGKLGESGWAISDFLKSFGMWLAKTPGERALRRAIEQHGGTQRSGHVHKAAAEPTISVAFQPVTLGDVAEGVRAEVRRLSDYTYGVEDAKAHAMLRDVEFRLSVRAGMLDEFRTLLSGLAAKGGGE